MSFHNPNCVMYTMHCLKVIFVILISFGGSLLNINLAALQCLQDWVYLIITNARIKDS